MSPALDFRRPADTTAKALPHSLDAEQAVIGSVLYGSATFGLIPTIAPEAFYEPTHARIWAVISERMEAGKAADVITVADRMGDDVGLSELGGISYLADLATNAYPANVVEHVQVVIDCAMRRAAADACKAGLQAVLADRDRPAFELVTAARRSLEEIERAGGPEDATMIAAPKAAAQAIAAMTELARDGRVRGKMTGLRCIDRRLGGLRPGTLVVIGGRPGMGKTSLARAIMHGGAVRNPQDLFLFCGVEMGPEEMMQRELAALTHEAGEGVEYQAMAKGQVTPFDLQLIDAAAARTPGNLILDDCHSLSIDDVRRKVWSLGRKGRLAAVAIDYLQLMRRPSAQGRNEASVLGEMTQTLKQIARRAGLCIVLLSQLSRAVESRDDKVPMLSDLRESGSIEQDADAVLFPFREYYYEARNEPKGGDKRLEWEVRCEDLRRRLDVICAKQRQGPVGRDRQTYFAEYDFIQDTAE